jgi:putative transposase
MQFTSTVFSSLLKPINRRQFQASVARHKGDRYAKTLTSWEHMVALVYGQLSGASSLRALETGFNAQAHQHYHLHARTLARSTLADANERRTPAIFAELLGQLIGQMGRKHRKDVAFAMKMIDSTPIPLGERFECSAFNGRIKGLKLHVVFDPNLPSPLQTDITPATINDVSFRHQIPLEAGVTYVFDRGYCDYAWWSDIHAAGAVFVTRPKKNAVWTLVKQRQVTPSATSKEDGFIVLDDRDVALASKGRGRNKLEIPTRIITIQRVGKRTNGDVFDVITNDIDRSSHDIAACYKARWAIELFFKWIKQNLNLCSFLGRSENAVRLQIIIAMITFVLIQIARLTTQTTYSAQRFIQLIAGLLPSRRNLATLEKPPPINPSKGNRKDPNQTNLDFKCNAMILTGQ